MAFFSAGSRAYTGEARMPQAHRGDPAAPSSFAFNSAEGPKFGAQAGKGNTEAPSVYADHSAMLKFGAQSGKGNTEASSAYAGHSALPKFGAQAGKGNPEAPGVYEGHSASSSKDGAQNASYGSRKAAHGVARNMAEQECTSSKVVIDRPAASKHWTASKHCQLPGGLTVPNNTAPAMSWMPPGTDTPTAGGIPGSAAAPAADWIPSPAAGFMAAPILNRKLPPSGAPDAHEVEPVSQTAKTTNPAASATPGWGRGGLAPVQYAPPELVGCAAQDPIHLGRSGPAGTAVVRDGSLIDYPLVQMKGSAALGIGNSGVGSSPPTLKAQQVQQAAQQAQNRVARRTSMECSAAPDGDVWKGTRNSERAAPEEYAKPDVIGMRAPTIFPNFHGNPGSFRGHLGQSFDASAMADVACGDGCGSHCAASPITLDEPAASSHVAGANNRVGCGGLPGAASSWDFGVAADGLNFKPEKLEFVDAGQHARTGGSVDVDMGSTLKSTPCFNHEVVGSKFEQSTAGCRQGTSHDLEDSRVLLPGFQQPIQAVQAAHAADAAPSAQDLEVGVFVLVDGAPDSSGLNGLFGQVIGYDSTTGMYKIGFGATPHTGTRDVDNPFAVADGGAQEHRTNKRQFRLKNKPLTQPGVARTKSSHLAEDSLQDTFPKSLEDAVPKPDMPDADVSGPAEPQDPPRRDVPDHLDANAAAIPLPSEPRQTQPMMGTSSRAKPRRVRASRLLQALNFDA